MTRSDKVRQAISLWRALQTRAWRLEHAGDGNQPDELHYRFEGIDHLVRSLQADDEGWQDFFRRSDAPVLTVVYEDDLEPGAAGAVRAVLNDVGVPIPTQWRPREVLGRQADALSDEWVAAYHRDAAGRIGSASLSTR